MRKNEPFEIDELSENVQIDRNYIESFMNVSLVDIVTKKIKRNIYRGKYLPGQRLIVRELSEELGVSHTPIKDALNRLVAEGYVEALPRKSMVVKKYSNNDFIDNLDVRLMCELFSVEDIIAKAKTDPSFIKGMIHDYQIMCECIVPIEKIDYESWVTHETQFHRRYMQACENNKLISIYKALDSNRHSYFAYLHNTGTPFKLKTFQLDLEEHKEIIDALESLNKKRFANAVTNHVLRSCDEYAIDEISIAKIKKMRTKIEKLRNQILE